MNSVARPATLASAGNRHAQETIPHSGSFYIPSLDGLRAISFFLVFLSHAGLGGIIPGGFGVTVFFLLSGFLITTLLRKEYTKYNDIQLGAFYLRRVFRILPPLYLALLLSIVLVQFDKVQPGIPFMGTLTQALQVSNYYQIFSATKAVLPGSAVLWSLAVEEHFYLVFPLLYLWMSRRLRLRPQIILLASICGLVLAWRTLLCYVFHAGVMWTFMGTDTRFDSILIGCLMAIAVNPVLGDPAGLWAIRRMKWLLPAAIALMLATFLVRNDNFRETLRYTLQGIALVPMFIAAIHYKNSAFVRFLNLPFLRFVGVLSYVLYLCHFMFLASFEDYFELNPYATGVLALTAAFLFATLVHYYVEKPLARARKAFSKPVT